ncbi:MAG TPA: nucleotidyl transferase AbiEii/AbiGii toxin family protein [Mucilaginibacter sp.]|jgi:predicted nucleotidyltransferase component of viral defense system|nr:nucleotidyl transferase AbiEii/AbiGii toxin family protein [Mucilaginibacter sp.]
MIPQSDIIEWSNHVPWQTNEQVEQDLVICRALVEIFNDEFLAGHLAFRGGTALHKLYLLPQPRYSEDLDFVQIEAEPIGEVLDHLRQALSFLGNGKVEAGGNMATMKFRFESEFPPVVPLRLKIETNCREHFSEMGWEKNRFKVESNWFTGRCDLTTYKLEELLGTKIRALYQRKKGRDLYDLYQALTKAELDKDAVIRCYKKYMDFSIGSSPTQKEYLLNLEDKMKDEYFTGDIMGLIRPDEEYDQLKAFELVKEELISRM